MNQRTEDKSQCKSYVNTDGGRYQVQWNDDSPSTPMGQLVFFAEFLQAAGLFSGLCEDAPLSYSSNNAPQVRDVLGSLLLSILAGHTRYAHLSALRFDSVIPGLLGMTKVVSEDSARRALSLMDPIQACQWQQRHLRECWEPLLYEPWVLDVDSTIKTIYGSQEGAQVGYNPHKPGRPSHVYHTYWMAGTRLCLEVEVHPGKEHAGKHSMPGLFKLIDSLPQQARPEFIRGDCGYGSDAIMKECESRSQGYLFKLRQTRNVKELIGLLETKTGWSDAGQGFKAIEGQLQLSGWESKRRVIVLRREHKITLKAEDAGQLALQVDQNPPLPVEVLESEYMVLVTNLSHGVLAMACLYRDRADSENGFDELKNQWGWSGFTTQDLKRCQIMARYIALAYNWWSLFVRLANPDQHHEAITSRPMMAAAVARQTRHAGQKQLHLSVLHAKADQIKERLEQCSQFLQQICERAAAEQLDRLTRWRLILSRVFIKMLDGAQLRAPPALLQGG